MGWGYLSFILKAVSDTSPPHPPNPKRWRIQRPTSASPCYERILLLTKEGILGAMTQF